MKSRLLSVTSLIIGTALFVYLLKQTGIAEILARVRSLGAGFGLILALSAFRHLARSYAWLRCMSDDDRSVGIWAVLRARLAGEAMADLTAAGPVIGEPIKIGQLRGKIGLVALASSLAVENLAYAISSGLLVLSGMLALLLLFAVGDSLRVASLLAIGLTTLLLLSAWFALKHRWQVISVSLSFLFALIHRPFRKIERVRELENYVFDFYGKRRADFYVVALCECTFHCAGVLEVFATLWLMTYPITVLNAFILEAVNRVLNIAFAFVPAMIGVDEAGTGMLANTLGLGAVAGVTLALIRKARMMVWIGLGLVSLLSGQKEKPSTNLRLP